MADPDSPDYLKPADFGVLWGYLANKCKHENLQHRDDVDKNSYPYGCIDCGAKFAACAVDNIGGVLKMHDFTVKRPRRRR